MAFNLLHVLTLLSVALVGSHAMNPEVYWKSVLPNTPIPKSIKDLLYTTGDHSRKHLISTYLTFRNEVENPEMTKSMYSGSDDEIENTEMAKIFYHAFNDQTENTDSTKIIYAPSNDQTENTDSTKIFYAPSNDQTENTETTRIFYAPSNDQIENTEMTRIFYAPSNDDQTENTEMAKIFYAPSNDDQTENTEMAKIFYAPSKEQIEKTEMAKIFYAPSDDQTENAEMTKIFYDPSNDQTENTEMAKIFYAPSNDHKENRKMTKIFYAISNDQSENTEMTKIFYATSHNQLKHNPNATSFFLENELHRGKEMKLHFTKNNQKAMFLPRRITNSIPFSSKNLPKIYKKFSVKPESREAKIMKQTLDVCESKAIIEGEEKYCATSLESMVDFCTTELGQNIKAVSTEVNVKRSTPLQKYKTVAAKLLAEDKVVICHRLNYAYAVFYCHKTIGIKAYGVSLVGTDGVKVKAITICHTDTTKWNPKHLAFQVLKVKPGTASICHILPEDAIAWVAY